MTSRQPAGRAAGNTCAHSEFLMAIATQGRAMSLGNPVTFSSHNLPHLPLSSHQLTRQAASLCLPRVIHLPVSLPNLTQSVCSQTSIVLVSPPFMDTPKRPSCFFYGLSLF